MISLAVSSVRSRSHNLKSGSQLGSGETRCAKRDELVCLAGIEFGSAAIMVTMEARWFVLIGERAKIEFGWI